MRSAGDDLISVAVADSAAAQSLAARLRNSGDWLEAVTGIESVVVQYDPAKSTRTDAEERLRRAIASVGEPEVSEKPVIEIAVVYGGEHGPDLELVCEKLGLTRRQFIAMHCGEYTVEMLGFIPGFAYIGGLDERLSVDRLAEPRQFVQAGSVGIAGGRSGLYVLPGPGGWHLIGRTSCTLFDASAENPFTLSAGMTVVFTAAETL